MAQCSERHENVSINVHLHKERSGQLIKNKEMSTDGGEGEGEGAGGLIDVLGDSLALSESDVSLE